MDVYLVPIGRNSFECYYEAPDDDDLKEPEEGQGFFARMRARFQAQLHEAERARHQKAITEPTTFLARLQRRSMRWIAERIAEQRLLWHLRKCDEAFLHAPADLSVANAEATMRTSMKRDADRHLRLLAVHLVGLIASAPVAFVPGPNVLGYLFTFTVVGHFLAWRGARNGLHSVQWHVKPSTALSEMRHAFSLETGERHRLIREVAQRLHMPRMATFVEQMATPSA